MLTFKQRYKPRTTREYTKSDLTVYDSAGNTALNALTVYGKSEVVDGVIKSAGEGWSVVRLADLTWTTTEHTSLFQTFIRNMYRITNVNERNKHFLCDYYARSTSLGINTQMDNQSMLSEYRTLYVYDKAYTTISDFVNSLGDTTLCYELDDPSQGNAIAVKTDNGTGINGTMAVFETGTPMYGISDTVRDVMTWNGSTGVVTKNCGEVDLGTLNYTYNSTYDVFITADVNYATIDTMLCNEYEYLQNVQSWAALQNKQFAAPYGVQIGFKNTDYTNPADFKTAMNGVKLVYGIVTPTTEPLTQAENDSLANLRTFATTTHFTNNADIDMTVNYTMRVPTIS